MLEKADSNNDGKISFEDFYSVMVKTSYWNDFIAKINFLIIF
jgi:Ca2+-binding EF-hand superfamily protein